MSDKVWGHTACCFPERKAVLSQVAVCVLLNHSISDVIKKKSKFSCRSAWPRSKAEYRAEKLLRKLPGEIICDSSRSHGASLPWGLDKAPSPELSVLAVIPHVRLYAQTHLYILHTHMHMKHSCVSSHMCTPSTEYPCTRAYAHTSQVCTHAHLHMHTQHILTCVHTCTQHLCILATCTHRHHRCTSPMCTHIHTSQVCISHKYTCTCITGVSHMYTHVHTSQMCISHVYIGTCITGV